MEDCSCGGKFYLLNDIGLVDEEHYYKTYRCLCGNVADREIYPLYIKYTANRYESVINIPKNHFLYNRGTLTNTIAISRFVWQSYYKQLLPSSIEVHHINGIKSDNRVYNLYASLDKHDTRVQQLPNSKIILEMRDKIKELEIEVTQLKGKSILEITDNAMPTMPK